MRRPAPARTVTAAAVAVAAVAVGLGGCSVASTPDERITTAVPVAEPDESSEIAYLRRMARFERQSDELAALALARSTDPTVRAMATESRRAVATTLPLIDQALTRLGSELPPPGAGDDASWPGLLTTRQMAAVKNATSNIDQIWASALIVVDREAVTLSTDASRVADDEIVTRIAADTVRRYSAEYADASRYLGTPDARVPLPPR